MAISFVPPMTVAMYQHGFFSAKIKLPADYTAGIVVAFYTSNADVFQKNHDELDFEFLGNVEGKPWKFQTNMYGNGSTNRGREERYNLWFDPSKEFHRYSILWTAKNIIFYIDEVPIREVVRVDEMGGDYPSKPMALYATIWDASSWATNGGKHKVDYRYAPFSSEFKELVLDGCPMDPIQEFPNSTACSDDAAWLDGRDYAIITPIRRAAMRKFRQHYMYYAYCYDKLRYPITPPECVIDPIEKERFQESGRLRYGGSHRKEAKVAKITRAARRKRRSRAASIPNDQASK
ncbi:Glycoside hydrolase, family 16 [Corchorus olitorius]|uniref:Xyloglucan endotransglucosylase/hydrolase n=1 Tax=Corchorus olitorius TaxID=93759 RepID=A0A1R3JEZ0_9ROSI|nr:Glycoside hydrolase, family 16 [Corchorus olitorius]